MSTATLFGQVMFLVGIAIAFLALGSVIGKDMELEAFTDLFNVFNRQAPSYVDETYTYDNVNPIIGGDAEDVLWAKAQDGDGNEPDEPAPATRNRNFRNAETRTAPLMARLGVRLTFSAFFFMRGDGFVPMGIYDGLSGLALLFTYLPVVKRKA